MFQLNTRAAQWAKLVVNKQRSGHSPKEWRKLDGQQVGENVYTYWNNHPGLQPNISEQFENAVDNWYYEICDDKQYPKRNFQGDVNLYHDTQVLWRSSREVILNKGRSRVNMKISNVDLQNFQDFILLTLA